MPDTNLEERNILSVLGGCFLKTPPVWIMRQAGRYLPEYRATRLKAGSFLELCYSPDFAVEVTLQPIRRFGFDASILFSDILVVPHALGQNVWFVEGEGPRLEPIDTRNKFGQLRASDDPLFLDHLAPVFETVKRLRAELPKQTTLLGFCGAPWTVASYMIAGRGSMDLLPACTLAARDPELLDKIIELLVNVQSTYLIKQLQSGADAVQIFESHAGILPPGDSSLERFCFRPMKKMIDKVRDVIPKAKIIVFARGSGLKGHTRVRRETGASATGVDWSVRLEDLRNFMSSKDVTQGNLNPQLLITGGTELDKAVDEILTVTEGLPHIFNLGHGITPQTPLSNVERMLSRIRGFR